MVTIRSRLKGKTMAYASCVRHNLLLKMSKDCKDTIQFIIIARAQDLVLHCNTTFIESVSSDELFVCQVWMKLNKEGLVKVASNDR